MVTKQFTKKIIATIYYEVILSIVFTKGKKIEIFEELIICDDAPEPKPIISAKNKVMPDNSKEKKIFSHKTRSR
jgi:hypothetical protein